MRDAAVYRVGDVAVQGANGCVIVRGARDNAHAMDVYRARYGFTSRTLMVSRVDAVIDADRHTTGGAGG